MTDFPRTTTHENRIALAEGQRIFTELREMYPATSTRDFDIILNSLAAALTCLSFIAVQKGKEGDFIELVNYILKENINE
jgi:hypothetical protein